MLACVNLALRAQLIKFPAPRAWVSFSNVLGSLVKCSTKFEHARIVYMDGYGLYSRANLSAYKVSHARLFGEMQWHIR